MRDRRYAIVALILAAAATIAGTGVAAPAVRLVTGKQIKNGAVTGKKIKNRSLTRKDLARGVLPIGATGAPGAAGATGATGQPGAAGSAAVASPFVDGP